MKNERCDIYILCMRGESYVFPRLLSFAVGARARINYCTKSLSWCVNLHAGVLKQCASIGTCRQLCGVSVETVMEQCAKRCYKESTHIRHHVERNLQMKND